MQRVRTAAFPVALIAALAGAIVFVVEDSAADLENLVFTSRADHLRVIVPRGWRASDQASYPGLVLWMARSQPQGQIVLTAEELTHQMYCSWPVACRTSHEGLPWKYACSLRTKLEARGLHVEGVQAGPKENEAAGLPSVWFEYQDSKHFMRHAIAFSADRAFSLVLSAPNSEARATHTRAFEQALRTMQLLTDEEAAASPSAPPVDAGARSASSGGASSGGGGASSGGGSASGGGASSGGGGASSGGGGASSGGGGASSGGGGASSGGRSASGSSGGAGNSSSGGASSGSGAGNSSNAGSASNSADSPSGAPRTSPPPPAGAGSPASTPATDAGAASNGSAAVDAGLPELTPVPKPDPVGPCT
jgi:uncharacterized membrane protein YgcG